MYQYQKFWDRIANKYAKTPIKDQHAFNAMVENIRKFIKEDDVVFDFGCGTGTYSIAVSDSVKSIHATDISEKMLAIARSRSQEKDICNITFEQIGIFDTKFLPESYDVVLAFNILHLQQDLPKTLQRIYELLTPGGLLISKTVCASESFSLPLLLLRPFSKLGLLPYVSCFSYTQLQELITQQHMKILEKKPNYKGSMEYFIVAEK